jgi:hypothetical protein
VRSLGFRGDSDWWKYCKSGTKPKDIPTNPNVAYKNEWTSWTDFLNTGRGDFRPFKKARIFVRNLGLRNLKEWQKYSRSSKRPKDIPANPPRTYKKVWTNWYDFLATAGS